MPVLTESLAEDVKTLDQKLKRLQNEFTAQANDFSGFRGSVETELQYIKGLAKWGMAIFTTAVFAGLASIASVIWAASALNTEVRLT